MRLSPRILTRLRKATGEAASVLVVSLLTTAVLAISLASYLLMVRSEYVAVSRSQSWNAALILAEAGAEEAMAGLNPGVMGPNGSQSATWRTPSGGIYGPVSRSLTNGAYDFLVTGDPSPVIYSTGSVTLPSLSAKISRVVRIGTTNVPLFTSAIAARTNIITLHSLTGDVFSDSFDSADPAHSVNGSYPFTDLTKTEAHGTIACLSGNVTIGGETILGNLLLGPTAQVSPNYRVSGQVHTDLSIDFSDAIAPGQSALPTAAANYQIGGTTYTYAFFYSGAYSLPSSGGIYIGPGADVTLMISSANFSAGPIRVAGPNYNQGKLTIYMQGSAFTFGADTSIDSGNPAYLSYFGLPTNSKMFISTNANFSGTIYAPSADVTIYTEYHAPRHGHPGSTGYYDATDFIGSCIAHSVTINGICSFHFDENLLRSSRLTRGVLANSWREL